MGNARMMHRLAIALHNLGDEDLSQDLHGKTDRIYGGGSSNKSSQAGLLGLVKVAYPPIYSGYKR
jgi:hypothetical protein